jgi:16S rRNA (adenine1518-N6/adenine1519-N6)-dimethyltransferase
MKITHQPRKRFGQNFLVDPYYIEKIIAHLQPQIDDNLIEIGPGTAALTRPLLAEVKALTVIEIDRDLIAQLQRLRSEYPHLVIIAADALQFDFLSLATRGKGLRIVGNLPYNITTPLLFHLAHAKEKLIDMHFMLQKEVVERIIAPPGDKTYGRLSVMMQYHFKTQWLFDVPAAAFNPIPKVNSAFLRLTPHLIPPYPANDYQLFSDIVRAAFNLRRKIISNSLKAYVNAEQLQTLGIDPHQRPEQLSIADFVKIANYACNN